jgi:hypothetical protein
MAVRNRIELVCETFAILEHRQRGKTSAIRLLGGFSQLSGRERPEFRVLNLSFKAFYAGRSRRKSAS